MRAVARQPHFPRADAPLASLNVPAESFDVNSTMPAPQRPTLGRSVYIAGSAVVCGDVALGDHCTIMHHVCIRGDVSPIRIGARVNIQDGTIVHCKRGVALEIADDVSVGHRAVVHCRRVGALTLIGSGAIVLDDAEIGSQCIVAAGALVTPGMIVPDGKVVMGAPARIVRDVAPKDLEYLRYVVANYTQLAREHLAGCYLPATTDTATRTRPAGC